ncbi:DinB family protein [Nocardioides immobilis]|uniref:DinB family protein n=1 Tax=Nocardioides immobilis TaxID=2049295 RepID=A0A417Y1F8_9ACTN|nr:DinB family protein [Nocardioides immobilis]RHW26436.1 DinB family protein [Nocardioides immobilis]
MDAADGQKQVLHRYLREERDGLLSKLDGLEEYDVRRPLTPTGTNLLGVVKHVASVGLDYFTVVFGRPRGRDLPWFADGAEPDADFFATPEEAREDIVDLYRFAADAADATITELALDAPGEVPWWSEGRRSVTLHRILVHMSVETARHAGHVDIVRELIDGAIGQAPGDGMVAHRDNAGWAEHRARVEAAARAFRRTD